MNDKDVQQKSNHSVGGAVIATISTSAIAALFGVGSGVAIAHIAPSDKFTWAGFVIAPLWFLLEIVFELFVAVFGSYSRIARITATTALLLGFYLAWFAVRPL